MVPRYRPITPGLPYLDAIITSVILTFANYTYICYTHTHTHTVKQSNYERRRKELAFLVPGRAYHRAQPLSGRSPRESWEQCQSLTVSWKRRQDVSAKGSELKCDSREGRWCPSTLSRSCRQKLLQVLHHKSRDLPHCHFGFYTVSRCKVVTRNYITISILVILAALGERGERPDICRIRGKSLYSSDTWSWYTEQATPEPSTEEAVQPLAHVTVPIAPIKTLQLFKSPSHRPEDKSNS